MKTLKKKLNYYAIDDVMNEKFAIDFAKIKLEEKYGLGKNDLKRLYVRLTDENDVKMQLLLGYTYDYVNENVELGLEFERNEDGVNGSIDYDYNYEIDGEYNVDDYVDENIEFDLMFEYDEDNIDRSIDYDYNYEMDCEYDGDEHLYVNPYEESDM